MCCVGPGQHGSFREQCAAAGAARRSGHQARGDNLLAAEELVGGCVFRNAQHCDLYCHHCHCYLEELRGKGLWPVVEALAYDLEHMNTRCGCLVLHPSVTVKAKADITCVTHRI